MREVYTALITAILTLSVLGIISFSPSVAKDTYEGLLVVTFLDVGQGDAVLIESPTGVQVLIDGGKDGRVLEELQRTIGFFDKDIDMIVATHPDADHIGGLIDVLHAYNVGVILMTENINDTPVYRAFMRAVEAEGAQIMYARAGQIYELGVGYMGTTTLRIIFPDADPTYLESNTSSIVAQLQYGSIEYLFTGDAPKSIEEYLTYKEGTALQSEVLKVGHHGSKTSTSDIFVSAVSPQYGIISAGKDNSYGHPHSEVTTTLSSHGVIQKNTADEGSITSYTNGKELWFR